MSVVVNNDHGFEVLKKVADEVIDGDNREYVFKVKEIDNAQSNQKEIPLITNVSLDLAGTEYSHAFQDNTKGFTVRNRSTVDTRLAWASGETGLGVGTIAEWIGEDSFNNIDLNELNGMQFLATQSGPSKFLTLRLQDSTSTGNIYATINDISGLRPGPTVLATSNSIDISTIGNTFQDVTFTFPSPANLLSGTVYSWVLHTDQLITENGFRIAVDTASTYPYQASTDQGGGWINTIDFPFNVDGGTGGAYLTLKRGGVYQEENVNLVGKSLYFQSDTAPTILEILEWT